MVNRVMRLGDRTAASLMTPRNRIAWLEGNAPLEENLELMRSRCEAAHEASLSVAVRDSVVNNISVQKGDYLGLSDGKIVLSGQNQRQLLLQLVQRQLVQAPEIVSFYYGKDVSPQTATDWAETVRAAFPSLEVEVYEGGQPHYPLLLVFE